MDDLFTEDTWCRALRKNASTDYLQPIASTRGAVPWMVSCTLIGSSWANPNGNVNVPVLNEWNAKRELNLNGRANRWNERYRFLARRNFLL